MITDATAGEYTMMIPLEDTNAAGITVPSSWWRWTFTDCTQLPSIFNLRCAYHY